MNSSLRDQAPKPNRMQEYLTWLGKSKKGDRFIYHIGLSPQDSYISSQLKCEVYKHYEDGLVHPFTVRKAPHIFEYIAVRSGKKYQSGDKK